MNATTLHSLLRQLSTLLNVAAVEQSMIDEPQAKARAGWLLVTAQRVCLDLEIALDDASLLEGSSK